MVSDAVYSCVRVTSNNGHHDVHHFYVHGIYKLFIPEKDIIDVIQDRRPVSIRNVWTLVQEFVEPMLHAQSRITIHHAHVTLAILGIHSDTAQELQLYQSPQKLSIHAFHHHVAQMQFVMRETEQPPVNVFQTTLETHMLPADQSVLSTQIVHPAKHVNNFTALTHVQELVE